MEIWPSIASSNLLNLENEISFVDKDYGNIHIDIEDGNYVPNITFGTKMMELICKGSTSKKSVHLMVTNQEHYIDSIVKCKINIVFLHLDNCRYPSELIGKFKNLGINVGITLNPSVAIDNYIYLYPLVNDILIMMSEPDGLGQKYIPLMESKIIEASKFDNLRIWVDGGITFEILPKLKDLNVSNVVMGRAIFNNRGERKG